MKKGALGLLLSPFGITQLVMIAAVGAALWLAYDPWRWGKVRESLREKFSDTAHIDGEMLARWIENPVNQQPVILDIRSRADFSTSHLPRAKNVSAAEIPAALGSDVKTDSPIVVYCTVGLDSAAVASSLNRRGFKRVQYLDGGIFLWANDGRPLVGENGPATKVNPGNSPHASLLKTGLHTR